MSALLALQMMVCLVAAEPSVPDDKLETPAQMWKRWEKNMLPFGYTIEKDDIVQSDTRPEMKLRRVEVKFYSLEIEGRKWGHPCVVFAPADPSVNSAPPRRGRGVIVAQRGWDGLATGPWRRSFLGNYGEPIAAQTGYPTMILPHPGEIDGENGREVSIAPLNNLLKTSKDVADNPHFTLATIYLRALDVMAEVLKVDRKDIRAVIGGHSKRATCAHTAATIDPRIRGVVYMGNESAWNDNMLKGPYRAVYPPFAHGCYTDAECIYLGATNEDGYTMFNVNDILGRMNPPWTLAYVPNYRHASQSEKHFIVWKMWVSHVFDGRPISKVSNLSYEQKGPDFVWGGRKYGQGGGTLFKCNIDSPNKIIQAKVWYVYNDDVPYWRDLTWYPEFMVPHKDGQWAGYVTGRLPDAWMVEVKDIANGFPGYVCSLPQDITHLPRERRTSRGSRSRNWAPLTTRPAPGE
ncbi:MAG TPA: hypothetical protein PKY77_26425 [Phycisphaerae bacterium]|nr:hypothetical protein [Phycisphaerae bacterium]